MCSSFWNFTEPLIETPLDRMPPARGNSAAPFDASGLGGAGAGVGAIGVTGSVLRLPENICMS
jgi:hypothetical protein